jgi:hypothetical protein
MKRRMEQMGEDEYSFAKSFNRIDGMFFQEREEQFFRT